MLRKMVFMIMFVVFATYALPALTQEAPGPAQASEAGKEIKKELAPDVQTGIAIAAGLGIAVAAFGGALGQGRAISAGLEGISRNPGASGKIFMPMIVGLALIESLVLYTFVIAILLFLKI